MAYGFISCTFDFSYMYSPEARKKTNTLHICVAA